MAYKHGVYVRELPTSIVPPVNTTAGLPVVYGTAPLHLASDPAPANRPVLCYNYAEAVAAFGYSADWQKYTLCEVIYSQFALYNRAPVVFVNVLDPAKHKTHVADNAGRAIAGGEVIVDDPVILSSLKVKIDATGAELAPNTEYSAAYNDDGKLIVSIVESSIAGVATEMYLEYDKIDASLVTAADIIGGISTATGECKGLETLGQVYPLYGLVPGLVLAPGWSDDPAVAAVMTAKAGNINEHFKAVVLADIPCGEDGVKKYIDVAAWKNKNNYASELMAACWPMVENGGTIYHLSTHLLGVIATVDSNNDDVPFESPSNKSMQITGLCLADGTEVILPPENANYLNSQGIITALNFVGGWKCWGNRTACYPANTDPKDSFLCVKRMFCWHAQTFILTYWAKVDKPITKRLIRTVVDSENIRLNGLVAAEALLGGRIEFIEAENPLTDLVDGKIKFHTYLTPPTPAREIADDIEYDPEYFKTLFKS